jgi:hypothetical protein
MLNRLVLLVDGRISTLIGRCAGTSGDPGGEVAIAANKTRGGYVVFFWVSIWMLVSEGCVR